MHIRSILRLTSLLLISSISISKAYALNLKVGDVAPNFSLEATNGEIYSLKDFKNKKPVVLAWYPKANTKGCTIECYSLAKNGDKIRQYNVFYAMASVDPIEKNRAFALKTKADFPMLSDPSKDIAKAYGVLNKKGMANRVTFYINQQGIVTKIDKKVKPAKAAEDMMKNLDQLGVNKI